MSQRCFLSLTVLQNLSLSKVLNTLILPFSFLSEQIQHLLHERCLLTDNMSQQHTIDLNRLTSPSAVSANNCLGMVSFVFSIYCQKTTVSYLFVPLKKFQYRQNIEIFLNIYNMLCCQVQVRLTLRIKTILFFIHL